jgi:hypothetical protein
VPLIGFKCDLDNEPVLLLIVLLVLAQLLRQKAPGVGLLPQYWRHWQIMRLAEQVLVSQQLAFVVVYGKAI